MRWLAALLTTALLAPAAQADTRPVNSPPLTDAQAAKRVKHSTWKPRPANRKANRHVLSKRQLRTFRAKSDMPYEARVTGRYRGTTDEIIQWAASARR